MIDNGTGLPKENRNRLLEPYVTTREKGTGLGLAIVGQILEEHGGDIELFDAPEVAAGGRGAWVRLRFAAESVGTADGNPEVGNPRSGERAIDMASDILIVDDEADIRELVAGILQDEGYRHAHRARQRRARSTAIASRRPNLVFLDIWLQGSQLDGLQLLDAVKERASRPAGGDDLRPRQHRDRGRRRSSAAPTTSSRSRSRPTGWCWSPNRALETSRLKREVKELKQLAPVADRRWSASRSAINQLRQMIEKVAPTNSRILIVGPSGAGKELAARTHPRACRRAPTGRSW